MSRASENPRNGPLSYGFAKPWGRTSAASISSSFWRRPERERYPGFDESELLDIDQYWRAVAGQERIGPRVLINSPADELRRVGRIRNPAAAVSGDLEAIEQIASVFRKRGWQVIRILTRDGTWEEILLSGSSTSAKKKPKR